MRDHRKAIIRYILLLLLLVSYFTYLSIEYGAETGGIVSMLTWSFFVLCTPIADAGFLVDFPLRLLFGIRMVVSEIIIWIIAISLNIISIIYLKEYYNNNDLMKIFYKILITPYPYWSIIILSCIGTFLSLVFGDEVLDIVSHKKGIQTYKYKIVITISILILILISYYMLIASMGFNFSV